jgi:2-polyprenyl-3-methyl-5-hydroxy-6-metoxy-1,4-benzoquinol methylase
MTTVTRCPACEAPLRAGLRPWHRRCAQCDYEGSTLEAGINDDARHAAIDEAAREDALHDLRMANFTTLLRHIGAARPEGRRLLDVGCAHGWFLELARTQFDVLGIEPDGAVARTATQRGLPVRHGFFPDALARDERFDIIVFNDVFEHIPGAGNVLGACRTHLRPEGLVVLNLPSSRGTFYRLATLLCRAGSCGPFERMWQVGLPSPHVHYFAPANLARLLARHGFELADSGTLATLRRKGLYTRIAYADRHGAVVRRLQFLAIATMLPALAVLPRDIIFAIARVGAGPASRP